MEVQQYSHMLDRLMQQEIVQASWSKTMDVLAVLYQNNQLEIFRVSEQLQRMLIINEEENITNIIVESNTILFTIGKKLYIYNLSTHQKMIQSTLIKFDEQIDQMLLMPVNVKQEKEFQLLTKIIPQQSTNISNWQNLCYLRTPQQNNIIFTLSNKCITINYDGIMPINTIQNQNYNQIFLYLDQLHCFNSNKLDIYDISQFKNDKIINSINKMALLKELITFVKTSILSINSQLQEIYKVYQLNIIEPLQNQGQTNINQQILQFYQQGQCPQDLVMFFQKELYNTKILQKMDDKVSIAFNTIQEILQDSLMNVLQRILIILDYFIVTQKMQNIDNLFIFSQSLDLFKQQVIQNLKITIKQTFNIFSQFQLECHESKLILRNFFVWLNQCAIKASVDQEVECENINSPLNKMELDLKKLYLFLSDEHLFTLKNLQSYYSDKVSCKSFFIKREQKNPIQCPQTDTVSKCLSQVLKSLFKEQQHQQGIECEEQFVKINQLVREIQNLQEQLVLNININLLKSIVIPIEMNRVLLSIINENKEYKFMTIVEGQAFEFMFNGNKVQQIYKQNLNNIVEAQYYQQEPIFLLKQQKKYIISSGDQSCQSYYDSQMKNLRISERGLLSIVMDSKKLIILAL